MTRRKKRNKNPSPKEQHRRKMQRRKDKPPKSTRDGVLDQVQSFTVSTKDLLRTVQFEEDDPEQSDKS